tara:strand:- start:37 stop:363 length:327 start_codon:yes stop_codon:yes gene_type:complete
MTNNLKLYLQKTKSWLYSGDPSKAIAPRMILRKSIDNIESLGIMHSGKEWRLHDVIETPDAYQDTFIMKSTDGFINEISENTFCEWFCMTKPRKNIFADINKGENNAT